jgi:hypothetical protein
MDRKGDTIFWQINEMETTKDELARMGFDRFIPRNDYRSALIKAIKKLTKGDEKLYRRYADGIDGRVSFAIFQQTVDGSDLNLSREIGIVLDKKTGILSPINPDDSGSRLYQMISEEYRAQTTTLDSAQFRQLVLRIVQSEGKAIALRHGGGIYFVDKNFDHVVTKLETLFANFKNTAKLSRIPIFDNPETNETLSWAISEDITADIATLVADIEKRYKEGKITKAQLAGDMVKAAEIVDRYKIHAGNLKARATAINAKLMNVVQTLKTCEARVSSGIVSVEDFSGALESL